MGDMLYLAPNSSIPVRVHGAFVRDQEVHAVVRDWKARERPQYKEGGGGGTARAVPAAVWTVTKSWIRCLTRRWISWWINAAPPSPACSASSVSVITAPRIIEQMEAQGIVSEQGHNGNREVLAPPRHD